MLNRRSTLVPATLLTLLTLLTPTRGDAQIGAVLEWINSLSGPGLVRVGPEVALVQVDDRNRIDLAPLFAVHVDDRGNADTDAADIETFGVQAVLESTLVGSGSPVELRSRLGVEIHRFTGNFESFWTPAFPAIVSLHVPVDRWAFRVGTGFNVYWFPDDAFEPFDTGVQRDSYDAGWTVQVGIEMGDFALFR